MASTLRAAGVPRHKERFKGQTPARAVAPGGGGGFWPDDSASVTSLVKLAATMRTAAGAPLPCTHAGSLQHAYVSVLSLDADSFGMEMPC